MLDQPLIINLAPTGAVADARKNPAVPIVPSDIIAAVTACARLGASMAHIHVRNEDGTPSCDPKLFARVLSGLREQPATRELILCATTSGRHGQDLQQRTAVLDLPSDIRPDMASLTLGSINFATCANINAPDTIRQLVDRMNERGVKPELEVFDLGMIEFAKVLIREGRLTPPYYFNLLLGNMSGLQATPQHLGLALSNMPHEAIVAVAGIGRYQITAHALGIASCEGVRVGLEDNLWSDQKMRSPSTNETSTQRIIDLCRLLGRSIATPESVRRRLGLQGTAPGCNLDAET